MNIENHTNNIGSMYPPDTLFRITKIRTINENIEDAKIVDGYWIIGSIPYKPVIGMSMTIIRKANSVNPEGRDGIVRTSAVTAIKEVPHVHKPCETIVTTTNSEYLIEEI
jgi:hypothetical protein